MILGKSDAITFAAMQGAKGAAATITGSDVVDFLRDSSLVWPKPVQTVDRGLNRQGPLPSKKSIVGRKGEGGYNLELRGSGTAGTPPNGLSPYLETLFGNKAANAAGTVDAGSGLVGGFDSTLDLTVGQLVKIDIGSGQEIRPIASKSGAGPYTYTVRTDFSEAPADAAIIYAGVSYFFINDAAANFMTIEQYVSTIQYLCVDAWADTMSFSLADEEVIKTSFNVMSLSCAKNIATPNPYTAVYDDTDELVGLECNMRIGSTLTNMKSLNFELGFRRTRGGINSTGISDAPFRKQEATANGTITPWMEDGSFFDTFFAGDTADIELTKGTGGDGEQLFLLLPAIQYSGTEISDDDGDFQWDLPFDMTEAPCIGLF